GAIAAARLRRLDEKADIIVLERGEYVSFANCGLPYYIGGVITDREDLTLQTPESFKARFNIDFRVLNEAVKINPDTKTVTVKDLRTGGTYEETYDNLILSMGAEPIRPNIEGADGSNVFTIRNIPDIYAVGDAVEVEDFLTKKPAFIPLAGPANKQGRIAADNIAGYLCSMKKLINYKRVFNSDFISNITVYIVQSEKFFLQKLHLLTFKEAVIYRHNTTPHSA
ncbi:MAG: FAD-dependent oxidoreductase, partial [Clostridia bacterium]|nr:FAD-dependent oxidoreductase [Clostridia bacterium]